jgi:hypothetical protein
MAYYIKKVRMSQLLNIKREYSIRQLTNMGIIDTMTYV